MSTVLGPNTRGVLHMIFHLGRLPAEQIDAVAAAWKRQPARSRARAWAAVTHNSTPAERFAIHDAAALARQDAMAAAARHRRTDWAFWAAAWDAAAGVAACGRIEESDYRVLVNPLARAMPWLAAGVPDLFEDTGLRAAIVRLGGRDD